LAPAEASCKRRGLICRNTQPSAVLFSNVLPRDISFSIPEHQQLCAPYTPSPHFISPQAARHSNREDIASIHLTVPPRILRLCGEHSNTQQSAGGIITCQPARYKRALLFRHHRCSRKTTSANTHGEYIYRTTARGHRSRQTAILNGSLGWTGCISHTYPMGTVQAIIIIIMIKVSKTNLHAQASPHHRLSPDPHFLFLVVR
jgi:hypothetical protein